MFTLNAAFIKKSLWLLALTAAAGAILLAMMGAFSGLQDVRAAMDTLPTHVYFLFAGALVMNTLLRGSRWLVGKAHLNLPVSGGRMFLFYVAGFSLAATPGKVGTAVRLWLLKQKQGISYTQSTPLFVLDQLTDFAAYLLLLILGVSALFAQAGLENPLWKFILFMGLLAGVFLVLFYPPLLRRGIKMTYTLVGKRKPRLFSRLLRIQHHIHVTLGGRAVAAMLLLAILGWIAPIFTLYYALNVMGVAVAFSLVSGVFTLVVIAGVLTFLPGGVGVTEAGLVGMLALIGAPLPLAVVLTALTRFFTLWLAILIGLVALPISLKLKPESASP